MSGNYDKLTAEELLKRYVNFDDDLAFQEIYVRYFRVVRRTVINTVGSVEMAEDISQEIFLKFAKQAKSYDSQKSSLSTYLFMMAKGEALEFRQRELKKGFFETIKDFFHFGNKKVEGNIFAKEIESQVVAAIKTLPEVEQQIFYLKFYAECSTSEIAVDLNLKENTVKTHIFKIRHFLIALLGDVYHKDLG